jgi:cytosine/adenosine deaminase-related metal-dependent hydrolase
VHRDYHDPGGAINVCLGPDGPVRCTPEFLKAIKAVAREYGTGIQMHLLETKYQRLYGLREKGMPLVRYLQELGFLGPEVSFAHGIWVTGEDMDVLAGEGASIVPNPSSNLRLFDGIAPVREMLARGVNVGLGTDSFGFSDDNDYLEEIRLALLLQRVPGIEGKTISGQEVLEMATLGGARALGLSHRIGSLQVGKRADLIALSSKRMLSPFMSPLHEPQEIICQRARREDMRSVMINGQLVLEDGQLTTIDVPSVSETLGEWYAEMWSERGECERDIKGVLGEIDPFVTRFFREYDDGTLQARSMYNAE